MNVDIRKYLNQMGKIDHLLSQPERELAVWVVGVISLVTIQAAGDRHLLIYECFDIQCKGQIEACWQQNKINWCCVKCMQRGAITHWGKTHWDQTAQHGQEASQGDVYLEECE